MHKVTRTFQHLASQTWRGLGLAHQVKSHVSENTVTESLLLYLKVFHHHQIVVHQFTQIKERLTGADWEWWFVGGNRSFGMRVQAKVLDSYKLKYKELTKKVGKARKDWQVDILILDAKSPSIAGARPMLPIYCFYNFWPNEGDDPKWKCHSCNKARPLWGCSVASASVICEKIKSGHIRLRDVGPVSWPWCVLTCDDPGRLGSFAYKSFPDRVRASFMEIAGTHQHLPNVTSGMPDYVSELKRAEDSVQVLNIIRHYSLNLSGILILHDF